MKQGYTVDSLAVACAQLLAIRPSALLTDLDGTLSPIAATPASAVVLPGCRDALAAISRRVGLVAVLSGRHPNAARAMVDVAGVEYFGVHGLARWTPVGVEVEPELTPFMERLADVAPRIRRVARDQHLFVEEKGLALAVHYRQAAEPEATRQSVLAALEPIAREIGFAVTEGRMVVEVRPPPPFGKGWRLQRLAEARGFRSLIYLGDDTTDMDACEALRAWRAQAPGRHGLAIAVGSEEAPPRLLEVADAVLADVPAVGQFLSRLAELLPA
jgi:trehalose 6-phosphate phosphatase